MVDGRFKIEGGDNRATAYRMQSIAITGGFIGGET